MCSNLKSISLGLLRKLSSTRLGCGQSVVDVVEEGDLAVARGPSILQLLDNMMARRFGGGVICRRYLALKGRSFLVIALNEVNGV